MKRQTQTRKQKKRKNRTKKDRESSKQSKQLVNKTRGSLRRCSSFKELKEIPFGMSVI